MKPIIPVEVLKHALDEPVLQTEDKKATRLALVETIAKTEALSKRKPHALDDPRPGEPDIFIYDAERGEELPGKLVWNEGSSKPFPVEDEQSARARNNADMHRRFLVSQCKRNGLDQKGVNLRAVVRYGDKMVNAFCTEHNGEPIMVYGEGDGEAFLDFTLDPGIAFHECRHAMTGTDSGLVYLGLQGALNEHLSDVEAAAGMQWHEGQPIENANWIIGGPVIGQVLRKEGWLGIRDMGPGKAYPKDNQPKHMRNILVGLEDNGHVHGNSGIPNCFFFEFCNLSGEKYSFEKPYQIWYQASLQLSAWSDFRALKRSVIGVCQQLYPSLLPALQEAAKEVGL